MTPLLSIHANFICPLTHLPMIKPVSLDCLHRFEKGALLKRITENKKHECPVCHLKISRLARDTTLAEKIKTTIGPLVYKIIHHEVTVEFYKKPINDQLEALYQQQCRNNESKSPAATLEKKSFTKPCDSNKSCNSLLIVMGSTTLVYACTMFRSWMSVG